MTDSTPERAFATQKRKPLICRLGIHRGGDTCEWCERPLVPHFPWSRRLVRRPR